MIDDVVVRCEDPVGQPVVAHELPDVLDRPFDFTQECIELGTFGWQRDNADVAGHLELAGHVPARLIHQHDSVGAGCHGERYLGEMQRHGLSVAERQDQTGSFAKLGADRAKDIGRFGPLVLWCRRPRAASGPAPRDLVLLADTGLILEPDLYGSGAREGGFDLCQLDSEAPFLKASRACSFWA